MKNMHKKALSAAAILLLAGCDVPPHAYYNRGDPENLLDASSEVVNMSLTSSASLGQLSDTITQDPPARAELHCSQKDPLCSSASNVLAKHGVASSFAQGGSGVTLIYERVIARDCENRYIDDTNIPGTLPPPTMGCSLMANTVQMVSDKREFVSPPLLDFADGRKAAQNVNRYQQAPRPSQSESPLVIYPRAIAPDWK